MIVITNVLIYERILHSDVYPAQPLVDQARRRIPSANCLDFREEFLLHWQIVSSIYDPNTILKSLYERDICFDSQGFIDSERNAVELNDPRDSKGKISCTSFKIWNILDKIFVLIHVQPHALSAIQQLQRYAIVFQNVLASNRILAVEEATYNPLVGYEDFLWTKKQQAIFDIHTPFFSGKRLIFLRD